MSSCDTHAMSIALERVYDYWCVFLDQPTAASGVTVMLCEISISLPVPLSTSGAFPPNIENHCKICVSGTTLVMLGSANMSVV